VSYSYNAKHIAQARGKYNPQKKNMGMLEWHIDGLVPGGQEILMLSLKSVKVPGYKVGRGEISYLNGTIFYPAKPEPLEEMEVVYLDYVDSGTRLTIERLFRKTYNPLTGTMGLASSIKSQGTLILLKEDDTTGRSYFLDGLFLMNEPDKEVDFTDGEQMELTLSLSVDFVIGRDV